MFWKLMNVVLIKSGIENSVRLQGSSKSTGTSISRAVVITGSEKTPGKVVHTPRLPVPLRTVQLSWSKAWSSTSFAIQM